MLEFIWIEKNFLNRTLVVNAVKSTINETSEEAKKLLTCKGYHHSNEKVDCRRAKRCLQAIHLTED